MAKRKQAPALPGDARLHHALRGYEGEQPLNTNQRELVERGYALFRFFYDQHRVRHLEIRNERKMRQLEQEKKSLTSPASNTLNSSVDNVIADQIDNMPEAMMLPERAETVRSAEEMTDVVGYVLYQSGWPGKFQTLMEDAVVTGTGIAEVLWDQDAENGDGMVNIRVWHPENFYPDPMYEDIQDGRGCFKVTHTTIAWVQEHYPHARDYVHGDEYTHQDEQAAVEVPQGDQKVTLLEFWYKRYDAEKRKYRVHMAQLAGGALLYSTETGFGGADEEEYKEGIYAHGQYPFTFYRYRKVCGRPFGTGLMHDYKDTQETIDRYYKYIDDNARQSSLQRHFIRRGCGINADDVADLNRQIIEWDGDDIRSVVQTVQASALNPQVFQMTQYLSDNMKQDSGQNQFTRGEGGLGVTAATAIQALQEAGGKITRWHTEMFKDSFREMVEQVLWVLSEYLEPGRKLRIVGGWDSSGNMKDRMIEVIAPGTQGDAMPKPAYTVRVQVQKNNPLALQSMNELLIKATEVCAQNGMPLPPDVFITLLQGYPNKGAILKAVSANNAEKQKMMELEATIEELKKQIQGKDAVLHENRMALSSASIAGEKTTPDINYDMFSRNEETKGV